MFRPHIWPVNLRRGIRYDRDCHALPSSMAHGYGETRVPATCARSMFEEADEVTAELNGRAIYALGSNLSLPFPSIPTSYTIHLTYTLVLGND